MTTAIEVTDLTKRYGENRAVDGVSFSVDAGEVFAILGPNGAGKSTTVEILEGHRQRDGGAVSVLGVDPDTGGRAFRDRIGIVLQEAGVDKELTVRETLDLYSTAYSKRRSIDDVIELVELTDKLDDRISRLSGGQQRRVDLALGIIGSPELLFLDEPTTGFDPAARRRSWELVRGLTADETAARCRCSASIPTPAVVTFATESASCCKRPASTRNSPFERPSTSTAPPTPNGGRSTM